MSRDPLCDTSDRGGVPHEGRTFRVFVSSTFQDLQEERNALARMVFPRLRELAESYDCRFLAIDLRWGVSEEASLDQQAMPICLDELRRCQTTSPRPNFLVLLGDRYGWCPLPTTIPKDEFERLSGAIEAAPERYSALLPRTSSSTPAKLLQLWYKENRNAVPPEFVLEQRHPQGLYVDHDLWDREVQRPLLAVLREAAKGAKIPASRRFSYGASATHQEVIFGALQAEETRDHVFAYRRTIKDLKEQLNPISAPGIERYLDLMVDGSLNAESFGALTDQWESLRTHLGSKNTRTFDATMVPTGGLSQDHVGTLPDDLSACLPLLDADLSEGTLCQRVWQDLGRIICAEGEAMEEVHASRMEVRRHEAFRRERGSDFQGRAALLDQLSRLLLDAPPFPALVHGASGVGLSSILARLASDLREANHGSSDHIIIERYIGTTPSSRAPERLISGICEELLEALETRFEPPEDPYALESSFAGACSHATSSGKKVALIIDGLENLEPRIPFDSHEWIMSAAKAGIRVMIGWGSSDGSVPNRLAAQIPEERRVTVGPMTEEEARAALRSWFNAADRTLTPDQLNALLLVFRDSGLPISLRFLFEEALRWRHDDPPPVPGALPSTVAGLFSLALDRMERTHSRNLVSHVLGFLLASRNGLTEDEIIAALSAHDHFFDSFLSSAHHVPPERHLPVVVWARLQRDLAPYLEVRRADGTHVMRLPQGAVS